MRALLIGAILACMSITGYAYHDNHKPGYYFVKVKGWYYPDYQYPRFDYYGYHKDCLCKDRPVRNRTGIHGMVRCYNHEGLSREYYLR